MAVSFMSPGDTRSLVSFPDDEFSEVASLISSIPDQTVSMIKAEVQTNKETMMT